MLRVTDEEGTVMDDIADSHASKAHRELSDHEEFHDALDEQDWPTAGQEAWSTAGRGGSRCSRKTETSSAKPHGNWKPRTEASTSKPHASWKPRIEAGTAKPQSSWKVDKSHPPVKQVTSDKQKLTFTVPQTSVGLIVGKNGQRLKEIEDKAGVAVYIDQSTKDKGYSTVTINPGPGAARAKELVYMYSKDDRTAADLVEEMEIQQCFVAQLIGPRGATINEIKIASGAAVGFDQSTSGEGFSRLRIAGSRQAVAAAKTLVQEKLAEVGWWENETTSDSMIINQQVVGMIIGFKGETLKELQRQSSAILDIDQRTKDKGYSTLWISGDDRAISKARNLVEARVAECQETPAAATGAYLECRVEQSFVGFLIGPKGATLRAIQSKAGVHIQVDQATREEGYSIVCIAPGRGQQLASKLIEEKIEDAKQEQLHKSQRGLRNEDLVENWEEDADTQGDEPDSLADEVEPETGGRPQQKEVGGCTRLPLTAALSSGSGLQQQMPSVADAWDDDCPDLSEMHEIAETLERVWAGEWRPLHDSALFDTAQKTMSNDAEKDEKVKEVELGVCAEISEQVTSAPAATAEMGNVVEKSDIVEDFSLQSDGQQQESLHAEADSDENDTNDPSPNLDEWAGHEHETCMTAAADQPLDDPKKSEACEEEFDSHTGGQACSSVTLGSKCVSPEFPENSPHLSTIVTPELLKCFPDMTLDLADQRLAPDAECLNPLDPGFWQQQLAAGLLIGGDSLQAQAQWMLGWQWPDAACDMQWWPAHVDMHSAEVNVERNFVGYLIGHKGRTIRRLSETLSVLLVFDQSSIDDEGYCTLHISGDKLKVEKAKAFLQSKMKEEEWWTTLFSSGAAAGTTDKEAHFQASAGIMAPSKLLRAALAALLGRWYGDGDGKCYEVSLGACAQSKYSSLTVRSWPLSEGDDVPEKSSEQPIRYEGDDVLLGKSQRLYLDAVSDKQATWVNEAKPDSKLCWNRSLLNEVCAEKTGEAATGFSTLAGLFDPSYQSASAGFKSSPQDFPSLDSCPGAKTPHSKEKPAKSTPEWTRRFQ
eukprot:TRINITY_DN20654_c0_g2_i2.p1 TRINITY_DN20654_c0_g2~~TRINITY_DN20654_c0_g2_i2.p1  ORF type:complete len:1048 (+),score=227.44 TRINITY_DN20654_c0_g2_i2:105-3248(+)